MPFQTIADIAERELLPGFHVRFIHTENMTIGHFRIEAGSELPLHHHPHEQVTTLLEGRFAMTLDGEERICEPGQAVVIPGNVPHSGKALTDCRIIDVFSPPREDYF